MTLETDSTADGGPVDETAVQEALAQIEAMRVGDDAKRARQAADAPAPVAYQTPVPVAAGPAYRAPTPVSSPFGNQPIAEVMGLRSPEIPNASSDMYGAPLPQPPRDMRNLEDVYLRFPDIGNGPTIIRVDRVEPKMHGTMPTAGILADLAQQISTLDFQRRFGGGRYKLFIIGPPRGHNRIPIPGAPHKTLAELELRLPGVPNVAPLEGHDMNQPYGRPGFSPQPAFYGPHPEVEIRRMELEAQRQHELNQERKNEPAIYQQFNEQQRESVRLLERYANERAIGFEAQLKDANARIKDLEARERELLEQKVALQREVADAKNMTETAQIREVKDRYELQLREAKDTRDRENKELRDRHESEMKHRMDEYVREKDRIVTDHRLVLEAETRRHADERQKLVDDVRTERDRTREQTADQIAMATKEHDRNIKSLTDNYENRIRQMAESHKDRIESLERSLRDQIQFEKNAHEQERRSLDQMRQVVEKTTEASAQMRIHSLEERLARAEDENSELSTEIRELHTKLNKPPGEYLEEVGNVAKNLLGMKTAEEAKASGDEDFSITKVAASSIKNLIEKAPELARTIADMRQGGPQAQAMAAQAQAQARDAEQQRQHQMALAQHNQQEAARYAAWQEQQHRAQMQGNPARRPGENARPPQWAQQQAPQAPRAAPPAAGNQGPRKKPAPPPTTGFPTVAPMASPISERVGVAPTAHPVDSPDPIAMPPELRPPPPPPMASAAPVPPPPAPMPPPPPPGAGGEPTLGGIPSLTMEAVQGFVSDLESAIRAKLSAKFFATEFVSKITPDVARQILERVTADQIIAQLEADAEQQPALAASPMMTLDGKRYIRDVFKQTAQLVGAQAA